MREILRRLRSRGLDGLLGTLAVVLLVLSPLLLTGRYWTGVLMLVVCWSLLAVGFNIAFSFGGILSFAQGTFFALSSYSMTLLVAATDVPLALAALVGVLTAGLAGWGIGWILVRMNNHNATIATVILAVTTFLAANRYREHTGGEDGIRLSVRDLSVGGFELQVGNNLPTFYLGAILLVGLLVALRWLKGSVHWKVLTAIKYNEIRAETLGFNVRAYRAGSFGVAAGIAGLGGVLYAFSFGHITTSLFHLSLSVYGILYAVFGGVGTVFGPFIGALLLVPLHEELSSLFVYVDVAIGLLVILLIVFVPRGIVGALDRYWSQRNTRMNRSTEELVDADKGTANLVKSEHS